MNLQKGNEKWRDFFIVNLADKKHQEIGKNKVSPEKLLTELTESDEY